MPPEKKSPEERFHKRVQDAKKLLEGHEPTRHPSYILLESGIPILEHESRADVPCLGQRGNKFTERGKVILECATCFKRGVQLDTNPPINKKREDKRS